MKKGLLSLLMAALFLAAFPLASFADADYGTRVPITWGDEVANIMNMEWSPDGKWIVFYGYYDVWLVPVAGGTPKLVSQYSDSTVVRSVDFLHTHFTNGSYYVCFEPSFSPDSKEITFSRMITTMTNGSPKTSGSTIEAYNIYTGERRVVMDDAYGGSYSRDGKYFAYVKHSNGLDFINNKFPEVVVYDILNGTSTTFPEVFNTFGAMSIESVRISPDNSWLVFEGQLETQTSTGTGSYNLYQMPLTGGTVKQLTSETGGRVLDWYPSISPDGKHILYTRMVGNLTGVSMNVYSMITGKSTAWFTENTSWGIWAGCFSPDGKKILYGVNDGKGPYNSSELYIRDFTPPEEDNTPSGVEAVVPAGFALTGNFPNPFNPSTHIAFTIPAPGAVKLSVYDVTGRKVRELVSSAMTAGSHEMVWDGRDESGATVSSGTYIARLKMGNYTASHRMLLMK